MLVSAVKRFAHIGVDWAPSSAVRMRAWGRRAGAAASDPLALDESDVGSDVGFTLSVPVSL